MRQPRFNEIALFLLIGLVGCADELVLPKVPSNAREKENPAKSSIVIESVNSFKPEDKRSFVVESHNLLLLGHTRVATNRKHFAIQVSHPISMMPEDAVTLNDVILSIRLSADRKVVFASIPDAHSNVLESRVVKLRVSNAVMDDEGTPLSEYSEEYETQSESNLAVNVIKTVSVVGYDNYASVWLEAENMAFAEFRYGFSGSMLDCLGAGCPKIEAITSFVPNFPPISGIKEKDAYDYELVVEDLFGRVQINKGRFYTRPLSLVSLNEIMANPKKNSGKSDSNAEYIELFNYGEEPIDLAGFSVKIGEKVCAVPEGGFPVLLPAKSFILLVGKKFDPSFYHLPESPLIIRMSGQSLCGNIRNSPLPEIKLLDTYGRILDEFPGMNGANQKGLSIERLNPAEKNGKERYCYSRADVGPTPLRVNSVYNETSC